MRRKIANLTVKIARRQRDGYSRFRLACVASRGSRVFAIGVNVNKPTVACTPNSCHAEDSCLRKVPDIDGGDLYVARVLADGSLGMAKPCSNCLKLIQQSTIDSVHYTNRSGGWSTLEIVHEE